MIAGFAAPAAAINFREDRLAQPRGQQPPVTRLLVQFRRGTSDASRDDIVRDAGGRRALRLRLVRALAVGPREGTTLEDLRTRLRSSDRVERVEDDGPIAISKNANDPGVSEQYAIKQKDDHDIDAPGAWSQRTNCAKVAVLDTGVQTNHPDLKGNLWENTKDPSNGRDDDGNGVVDDRFGGDLVDGKGSGDDQRRSRDARRRDHRRARQQRSRHRRLCWSVKIIAVRVLDANGHGTWSQEIAGIDYAIGAGAKVDQRLLRRADAARRSSREAIQRAKSKGVLLVAAAGNDGVNADAKPAFPAAYPDSNILSVAATDSKDKLAVVLELRSQDAWTWPRRVTSSRVHLSLASDYAVHVAATSMAAAR